MKKILIILSVILTVVFIAGLSASMSDNEEEEPSGTTAPSVQTTTSAPVVTATPAETTTVSEASTEQPVISEPTSSVVQTAEALIGIDFAEGGASPAEGFDNSGFIYYVLRENGYINCPRQISAQLEWGENAGYEDIKAGDVVYFSNEPDGEASFGGIYTGNGIMVYSPYPGEKVKTADITEEYWKNRFVTALSL